MTTKEANQLNAAKTEIKESWVRACQVEGVPSDSVFVVFSDDNQAAIQHNTRMLAFIKLRNRIARNVARRERHAAMTDLGLKRVKGALGGVYYE